MKNTPRSLLVLLLITGMGAQPCRAGLSEVQIESAYVYNFIKFVEWPAATLKNGDKIRLCILGNNALHTSLSTLNGHRAGVYALQIVPRDEISADFSNCHVLYIDELEQRRMIPILKALKNKPVLTISDIPNFAERGGVIGLLYTENKVLFEINLATTQKAGLRLSSQMLNLAANIFGK